MGEDQRPLLSQPIADEELQVLKTDGLPGIVVSKQNAGHKFPNGCDDVCVTIPIPSHLVKKFSPEFSRGDATDGGPVDGDVARMQRALALVEADVPSLGKASAIDPFVNETPRVHGAYESVKTALLLPVLVLRLLLVGLILAVGYLATKVALAGWESESESAGHVVLPRWRRKLMGVTRLCGRGLLYCFGCVIECLLLVCSSFLCFCSLRWQSS